MFDGTFDFFAPLNRSGTHTPVNDPVVIAGDSPALVPITPSRTGKTATVAPLPSPVRGLGPKKQPVASSAYWRVPDSREYLTAVSAQASRGLCAVGSGSRSANLFVYELAGETITHHQTITLPEVHSLTWVPSESALGSQGNVLVSGHKGGMVHMTLLPDATESDVPAEILKRYNHVRHLPADLGYGGSTRIKHVQVTGPNWRCVSESSIASLCAEHLFLWEPSRSDVPLIKQRVRGATAFDLCGTRDGILAIGARRAGVSIRDVRVRGGGAGLSPPEQNEGPVSSVKWSPHNEYWLAAVHSNRVVKVWDIRQNRPMAAYSAHTDKVCGVEWNSEPESSSELVTASADGTIRVWDALAPARPPAFTTDPLSTSPSTSPPRHHNSPWNRYRQRGSFDHELDQLMLDLLDERPRVQQKREFRGLAMAGPQECVTVDSAGFLGLHQLSSVSSDAMVSDEDDISLDFGSTTSLSASSDSDFIPPPL